MTGPRTRDVPGADDLPDERTVEWPVRRRWLLVAVAGCTAYAVGWLGVLAAFGPLDRPFAFAYFLLTPSLPTVAAVWGRRLRLTPRGVEYVGGLSRLSVTWCDVEAVDRRHLTYTLARETTTDTGLQISMDSAVRGARRSTRRIPLRPFVDDEGHRRLHDHRPDLTAE